MRMSSAPCGGAKPVSEGGVTRALSPQMRNPCGPNRPDEGVGALGAARGSAPAPACGGGGESRPVEAGRDGLGPPAAAAVRASRVTPRPDPDSLRRRDRVGLELAKQVAPLDAEPLRGACHV